MGFAQKTLIELMYVTISSSQNRELKITILRKINQFICVM
jgi:hypothetical protein